MGTYINPSSSEVMPVFLQEGLGDVAIDNHVKMREGGLMEFDGANELDKGIASPDALDEALELPGGVS